MIFSDKVFEVIRALAEIIVPAIGALYLGVAAIWGLPYGDEVSRTCIVIATFLGAIVTLSRKAYNEATYTPVEEEIEEI